MSASPRLRRINTAYSTLLYYARKKGVALHWFFAAEKLFSPATREMDFYFIRFTIQDARCAYVEFWLQARNLTIRLSSHRRRCRCRRRDKTRQDKR